MEGSGRDEKDIPSYAQYCRTHKQRRVVRKEGRSGVAVEPQVNPFEEYL